MDWLNLQKPLSELWWNAAGLISIDLVDKILEQALEELNRSVIKMCNNKTWHFFNHETWNSFNTLTKKF